MDRLIGLAILVLLLVSGPARAETLRLCYEEWAPFAYTRDGEPAGLMVQILDRALDRLEHDAIYVGLPYSRCRKSVDAGVMDAMMISSNEPGLKPNSVSLVYWEVGLVARADWPSTAFEDLSDFDGRRVGLVSAYDYGPTVREAAGSWIVQGAVDAMTNLRKVSAKRLDLTVVDGPWARHVAKREGLSLKFLTPLLFAEPQFLFFRPDRQASIDEIDRELRRLIADGSVDRLYRDEIGLDLTALQARAARTLAARDAGVLSPAPTE